MSNEKTGGLDAPLRRVAPPPPMRDGYRTGPGATHRNGLPETHPYAWNDHEEVAEPSEIARALHRELGLRYYGCCRHCRHPAADPPHTIRCDGGCNDAEDGEQP